MDIHEAAARGDVAAVAHALASGQLIDAREPSHGYTPLMTAVTHPQASLALVRFLLTQGADVNARSWTPDTAPPPALEAVEPLGLEYQLRGETALTLAARNGDVAIVTTLLDAGSHIHAATTDGYDALINATFASTRTDGPADLVALLLERGADPNHRTMYRETALTLASRAARFDIVALLLAAGADRAPLHWTALMAAVVEGTLGDVHAALHAGAELEARDHDHRTALDLSMQVGDLAKARALHTAGAACTGDDPPRSALVCAVLARQSEAVTWLIEEGCDREVVGTGAMTPLLAAVSVGDPAFVRQLLDAGARADRRDAFGNTPMSAVTKVKILHLLHAAGGDLNDSSDAMRQALFGLPVEAPLEISRTAYLGGKERRFGTTNPEVMNNPFWQAMVRSRVAAYTARHQFCDTDNLAQPVWCFQRFGRTLTALPDGRYVEIGGEHEDYYDPDFCIYNDVVVYHGDGRFTVYGYPADVFPPTDFHTATVVGPYIYVIGSLGYMGTRRPGETPVYRLRWDTWQIERVTTQGTPPGWISCHQAGYQAASHSIVVRGGKRIIRGADGRNGAYPCEVDEEYIENIATYVLDLTSMTWYQDAG